MKFSRSSPLLCGGVVLALAGPLKAQPRAHLTYAEVEKLRNAQDSSERIKVYLAFAQQRLDRAQEFGSQPAAGSQATRLLSEYISITDEMKRWIQYQYDHGGDMRAGLKALIEQGPRQIATLRHMQAALSTAPHAERHALRDAIADMTDAVDGGTQALSVQEKKFGKLKQERKLEAREIKARRKAEEKRNKEEKKLLKRLRQKHSSDEGN